MSVTVGNSSVNTNCSTERLNYVTFINFPYLDTTRHRLWHTLDSLRLSSSLACILDWK